MIKIEFPKDKVRVRDSKGGREIFDPLRKKWLVASPEEWVRQNLICYMIHSLEYPAALIATEREILVGEMRKRFDLVVFNKNAEPWMMIECKEMNITIDRKVLEQVLRYHSSLPCQYLVITNGSFTYAFKRAGPGFAEIHEFPAHNQGTV